MNPINLVVVKHGGIYEHWSGRKRTMVAHAMEPLTPEGVETFRRDPTPFVTREPQTS
jgi:hypothetical protein